MTKHKDLVWLGVALVLWTAGLFVLGFRPPFIEILGVALLAPAMVLMRKQSIIGFVFLIIACSLLMVYFLGLGLYGQVLLRFTGVLNGVVSIYFWRRGAGAGVVGKKARLCPTSLSSRYRLMLVAGFALLAMAAAPMGLTAVLDFVVAYAILMGGLLLIKKKTEAWWMWLVGDLIMIPLFMLSGSWMNLFFASFSATNDVMAIKQWRKC